MTTSGEGAAPRTDAPRNRAAAPDGVSGRRANFSAGPAVMPEAVLERIREELLDWRGTGVSVMETSHRSTAFVECAARAEADLRALLDVPDDYRVLFLQGGASAQFALTVMNLAGDGFDEEALADRTPGGRTPGGRTPEGRPVAFADTGYWSRKAIATARRLVPVHLACEVTADETGGTLVIPPPDAWSIPDEACYLHLCDNETIDGVAFDETTLDALARVAPGLPIVADMSSSILSRPIDVSRYALIYAGAQKNIGPAGITVVLASPEAMARSRRAADLPGVFSYAATDEAASMLNTPPTFAWYAAGLVFEWLLERGGLAPMAARNRAQAARVYDGDRHPRAVLEPGRSALPLDHERAVPRLGGRRRPIGGDEGGGDEGGARRRRRREARGCGRGSGRGSGRGGDGEVPRALRGGRADRAARAQVGRRLPGEPLQRAAGRGARRARRPHARVRLGPRDAVVVRRCGPARERGGVPPVVAGIAAPLLTGSSGGQYHFPLHRGLSSA